MADKVQQEPKIYRVNFRGLVYLEAKNAGLIGDSMTTEEFLRFQAFQDRMVAAHEGTMAQELQLLGRSPHGRRR